VRFRKINCTPSIRSDLAVSGASRPRATSSVIAELTVPFFRVLSIILLCLTLTEATGAGASSGPVVGWGSDTFGQATGADTVTGPVAEIAAGSGSSCAIQAGTGNVVCWGYDSWGQATPPDDVNGVSGTATRIAAGGSYGCAIQAGTGNVVCWGRDADGQATPPDAVNGVSGTASAIAAGSDHSCAIQAGTGNVVCWGRNYTHDNGKFPYSGQATPPDAVNGVSGTATDIAAGGRHSCAIQAGTGNVVCWGWDYSGQAAPPDSVNGVLGGATDITARSEHSCAIQASTGNVVCWGSDQYGQATPPEAVNGGSGTASDISAGYRHSCAIQAGTGNVVCWGSNIAPGDVTYAGQATPPDAVIGVSGTATAVAAGGFHSCAIQAGTGTAVCWGWDHLGQSTPPDNATGPAIDISAGGDHSCAIQVGTANVVCWGSDEYGQVTPPDAVNGVSGSAADIVAGYNHSCAIQAGTGNVVCWGSNFAPDDVTYSGQAMPPDTVNGVSGTATDISALGWHNCAIQAGTGAVVCWGYNRRGAATPPEAVNGGSGTVSDISAGYNHSCAIQASIGNVVCWGEDSDDQATPPDAVNGVSGTASAIAAGGYHSCAIQAGTGNVVCWGGDYYGQSTPPDAVNGISGVATDISAGANHSCAIQAGTGNAVCWGQDSYGQATPSDAVNGVLGTATKIAAGARHTLAIVAAPEPISLTKPQQACVNAMNKSGEKVNKAQLWENERCLRDFQEEALVAPMTFGACMTADRKGRVQRVEERTVMRREMKCDSLDLPPPIAYTSSATVNAAAVDGALALTHAIFGGPPVLDTNLVTRADDRKTARCQFEMLKRADNLVNTVLKEVVKAKKRALRDDTVDSEAAFEAKLQAVLSSNERLDRTEDRFVRWVDGKCANLQTTPDTIFPGECGEGSSNLSEVAACVIAAARCKACSTVNAFDDLNLDCDQADDQTVNWSCP
jgi:alpha-tubulin suppressor-like RCC1 family protein